MDPVTTAAIAGAAGGAAGKMLQAAADIGGKWLSDYFKDYGGKAIEAANENALGFLNDLALRIKGLEAQGTAKEQIESALDDPDFAATLKTALIASARTSNAAKHELLGRAVAERLAAEPDSLVTLASALAIEAIPHLSPMHLSFLGTATLVYYIRPRPFPWPDSTPENFGDRYNVWLTKMLSAAVDPQLRMSNIDYVHLVSVACLSYDTLGSRSLAGVLGPRDKEGYPWDANAFLNEHPNGLRLSELWEGGMQHVTLTSAGQLIGVYVIDQKTGTTTIIDW